MRGSLPASPSVPTALAVLETRPTASLESVAKIIRRAMQDNDIPARTRSERAAKEIAAHFDVLLRPAAETNPMERLTADALRYVGLTFITDHDARSPANLDFYLPGADVHIEVKRFHSERWADQLRRAENVVLLQGEGAVRFFANALKATPAVSQAQAGNAAAEPHSLLKNPHPERETG